MFFFLLLQPLDYRLGVSLTCSVAYAAVASCGPTAGGSLSDSRLVDHTDLLLPRNVKLVPSPHCTTASYAPLQGHFHPLTLVFFLCVWGWGTACHALGYSLAMLRTDCEGSATQPSVLLKSLISFVSTLQPSSCWLYPVVCPPPLCLSRS